MTRPTCAQRRSRGAKYADGKYADGGKRGTGPRSPEAPLGRAIPLVHIHSGGRPQVLLQAPALILSDWPMDKRWVKRRRRADSRFSPSRNFAGGRKTLPTPETQWRRHATRIPFFASVCSQAASALFCFGSRKNFFGGKNGKLRRPVRRGLRRVDDRRSDRRRGIPRYPKLGDG